MHVSRGAGKARRQYNLSSNVYDVVASVQGVSKISVAVGSQFFLTLSNKRHSFCFHFCVRVYQKLVRQRAGTQNNVEFILSLHQSVGVVLKGRHFCVEGFFRLRIAETEFEVISVFSSRKKKWILQRVVRPICFGDASKCVVSC